jgi:DNA replication and repair protein RecF
MLPRFKYPVVLFEPDDLRLLNGSPSRRRDYFDRFISQLDPLYGIAIRKYDRALKQRNNLLKRAHVSPDELFVWDMVLSEHGAYIIQQRALYVAMMHQQISIVYNKIADSEDTVAITYHHSAVSKQKLLADLHANTQRDMITGFTSAGPHRHDIIFSYNGAPALSIASRGEVRSIMLALKFIEVDILQTLLATKPIILLDDVFSELDASRQKHLVANFKDHQVIITSATSNPRMPAVHLD